MYFESIIWNRRCARYWWRDQTQTLSLGNLPGEKLTIGRITYTNIKWPLGSVLWRGTVLWELRARRSCPILEMGVTEDFPKVMLELRLSGGYWSIWGKSLGKNIPGKGNGNFKNLEAEKKWCIFASRFDCQEIRACCVDLGKFHRCKIKYVLC